VIQYLWASKTFLRLTGIEIPVTVLRQQGVAGSPHVPRSADIQKWILNKVGPYRLSGPCDTGDERLATDGVGTIAEQLEKYEILEIRCPNEENGRNTILKYFDQCDKVEARQKIVESPATLNLKTEEGGRGQDWRIFARQPSFMLPSGAVRAFNDLLPPGHQKELQYIGQIYTYLLDKPRPDGDTFTVDNYYGWFQVDEEGDAHEKLAVKEKLHRLAMEILLRLQEE